MSRSISSRIVLVLALSFATCGCSSKPEIVPVSGEVHYQGEPLKYGSVMFQPDSGQPARGIIQPDGTFQLWTFEDGDGATVGHNRVRITCFEGQSQLADTSAAERGELSLGKLLIPKRYTGFQTSGLEVDVKRSDNPPVILNLVDE